MGVGVGLTDGGGGVTAEEAVAEDADGIAAVVADGASGMTSGVHA